MKGRGNFPLETFSEVICFVTWCWQQADPLQSMLERIMEKKQIWEREKNSKLFY